MANFNIHPADLYIRELVNARAFEFNSVTEFASSVAVLAELKCTVCSRLVVEDFNWCQTGEPIAHSICGSCIKVYKEEVATKTLPTCPIIHMEQDKAVSCDKKLVGFENGVLRCMDHFLNLWKFPCGAKRYGCTFVGTKGEVRAHEVSQCTYKYLRVCSKPRLNGNNGELCGKQFRSHLELIQHLEEHGIKQQHLDESTYLLAFKDVNELTDEWVAIDRRLVDCPNGLFCTLVVCKNNTDIRLWLQEIKSEEKDARRAKLPVYCATTPAGHSEIPQYSFKNRIFSYNSTGLAEDGFQAFVVAKEFLRLNADCQLDGNIHFSVKFNFFGTLSSPALPSSTDAGTSSNATISSDNWVSAADLEIDTPSILSVTEQIGPLDEAIQPIAEQKELDAVIHLEKSDAGTSINATISSDNFLSAADLEIDTPSILSDTEQMEPLVQAVQPDDVDKLVAEQKKPDAVIHPGVQKSDDVAQPVFKGHQRKVNPKEGWKTNAPQKFKDGRRHGGAESKDYKGKSNTAEGYSQPAERKRSQGHFQSRSMWKSNQDQKSKNLGKGSYGSADSKDSGEKSRTGGSQAARQETFPPKDVGNPAAAKEGKDSATAGTNPQATTCVGPFRIPAAESLLESSSRGRNQPRTTATVSDAYKQRWMGYDAKQKKSG